MEDHQQERAGGGSVNSPPLSSQITVKTHGRELLNTLQEGFQLCDDDAEFTFLLSHQGVYSFSMDHS